MLTMQEILNIVPAWTVIDADAQVRKDRLYIDRVLICAKDGDLISLYDGVGTTGRVITLKQTNDDTEQTYELGVVFNDGLYVNISDNTDRVTIVYRPFAE